MTQHTQQDSARRAADEARLTAHDLWLHYFSIGGALPEFELDAYLHGMFPLGVCERNMIAVALNEVIDDLPPRRKADLTPDLT